MLQTAYWPCPPVCFTWRPCAAALPRIVSRYAIFAGVVLDLDAELRLQPAHLDVEVRLAHAVDHGLVRLLVAGDAERRVLLAEPREPGRELVLVALGLRARSRRRAAARAARSAAACTGSSFVDQVSPVWACWSFATAPMSPARTSGTDSCSLPALREQLADPLLGALRRVEARCESGRIAAAEHPEHRDVPDERVRDRLEHERAWWAADGSHARSCSSPPLPSTVTGAAIER